MEELLKMFTKKMTEGAEIRVTPSEVSLKGNKITLMAMISALAHNITRECLTEKELMDAIEVGLKTTDEEVEEKSELNKEVKEKRTELEEIVEIAKRLADIGKEIENL